MSLAKNIVIFLVTNVSPLLGLSWLNKIRPNEIYNLGAQSHVGHSFEIPEYTSEVSGLGTLRILEAMRFLNLKKCKFYQASTSELFGETFGKNSFTENLNIFINGFISNEEEEINWSIEKIWI